MSDKMIPNAIPRNGDDYIRRLSKAVAQRRLKRSAERSGKRSSSSDEAAKRTSDEAAKRTDVGSLREQPVEKS